MYLNPEESSALSQFSERFTLNSFLPPPRLSLPNLHAITLGGTPALHVSYRKFHNSCKQDRCSAAGCPLKQPHLPLLLPLLIFPLFLLPFLLSLVPCCFSHPSLGDIALLCFLPLASLAFSLSFASLPFLSGTFYDPRCSLRNPLVGFP